MDWIALSYTLPSAGGGSGPRVALWRRLKRLGAVALPGNIYVLPAQPTCIDSFQWLAGEIRGDGGEALLIRVEQFEGMSEAQITGLFCEARGKDYEEIAREAAELERGLSGMSIENVQQALARLRKQQADIRRIDYFNCPEGTQLDNQLTWLERMASGAETTNEIPAVEPDDYRGRVWVTRPRPHVDRLACAWLIRQFIDADAVIRFDGQPRAGEVAFDMADAEFTHVGALCTFETMVRAFRLDSDAGLMALAEIVHEIDLRDGQYGRPEIAGIDAVLGGWLLANLTDGDLEAHGIALFRGLYAALGYQRG